jgi:flagellar biosynthesis/type III secretory pathway chaperone
MTKFEFTVDTKPMADEISSVSRHVNVTTGAVVAMKAAVVLAEEKAANHVCNNVNRGFYSLIRSQISQKTAKLQSEVDSHLIQLMQQKKALIAIKARMNRDYNMIAKRYIKLFNALNSNLKQRVFELDKPTINFAVKEVDKFSNRTKYLTATIPITQNESLKNSQQILSSNLKSKGFNVIGSMKGFLMEMNTQKKLTDRILIKDGRYRENAVIYIPVAISEKLLNGGDSSLEVTLSNTVLDNYTKSEITNSVMESIPQLNWKDDSDIFAEVKSEYVKLVDETTKSERVKELAMKLFLSNNYQTI